MKILILPLILSLSACGHYHRTELVAPPKDPQQFEVDLAECKAQASNRWHAARAREEHLGVDIAGAFLGPIAGAAADAMTGPTREQNPDYYKNVMELTDECMSGRGYDVAED